MHVTEVSENQERENMTEVISEKIVEKYITQMRKTHQLKISSRNLNPTQEKHKVFFFPPEHIIKKFLKIKKTNLKLKEGEENKTYYPQKGNNKKQSSYLKNQSNKQNNWQQHVNF